MKICASLIFYNERDCLKQCLDSLKDFELVICCDGKWAKFDDPNANEWGLSYDGSRELIKSYPNTILLDCGNQSEESMVNLCLRESAKRGFDFDLMIASDEYIKGDLKRFLENAEQIIQNSPYNTFHVDFKVIHITPPEQRYDRVQRLVYNPMFVRLRDIHWIYYYNNQVDQVGQTVPGITIYHDDTPRNELRERQMLQYQAVNVPREWRLAIRKYLDGDLENKLITLDINTVKILFSENEINWWQTKDGRIIYTVSGQIDKRKLDKLRRLYNVDAWMLKGVLQIMEKTVKPIKQTCPECDDLSITCKLCGKI